ncbi:MAG: TIGR02099 family protein, partial [Idiomarina sp.]|nr:TIGR02099 family protein [Idiomarina sp.]
GLWPQPDGFLMTTEDLTLRVDDAQWPVDSVRWGFRDGEHIWNLNNLTFSETAPLWSLFGSPGAQIRDWFEGIQPEGVVNEVQVRLDTELQWSFYARADDIRWQSHRGLPGLDGLGFELWSRQDQGAFSLHGDDVNFVSPATFSDTQQLSQIDWSGYWTSLEDGFRVALPHGQVSMANVVFNQQFTMSREQGASPVVEWWLEGSGADLGVSDALQLLPLQIGAPLTDYLQNAVLEGEVNKLNMLWRGDLDSFPYYHSDGIFMARLQADDLDFKFQPDWPAIEQTQLVLGFRDQSLHINASGGSMMGAELHTVDALIADLMMADPWLRLTASARSTGHQARALFNASPLADSVGNVLTQLESADAFDGSFALELPLFANREDQLDDDDTPQARAHGQVEFTGQSMRIVPLDLELANLQGTLQFDGNQLDARAVLAEIYQLPVYVSLQGGMNEASSALRPRLQESQQAYQLSMQMDSLWPTEALSDSPVLSWLAPHVEGEIETDTDFTLQIAEGYLDYDWHMRAALENTAVHLPQPIAKQIGDEEYIDIRVRGDEARLHAQVVWPDAVRFETELTIGQAQLDRALIELGSFDQRGPAMPEQGMDLYANVDQLDLGIWFAAFGAMTSGDDTNAADPAGSRLPWQLPPLHNVSADVQQATWLQQQFDNLQLSGERDGSHWALTVNAEQGRAHVSVPMTPPTQMTDDAAVIQVQFDYLNLAREKNDQRQSDTEGTDMAWSRPDGAFFDRLPAFHLVCEVCRYDGNDIGRIEARLNPSVVGAQLEQLHIRRSGAEVNMTGGWYAEEGSYESYINGWVAVADVGNLVADFGSSSVVRDSSAQVELSLNWAGSPAEFDLANLNGEVDWRLGSGYLRDVSDGGARLFSLFSLESLMRKLTLDFRDIFARGMFYSSFRGTLNVEDGIVFTDNTRMNGSAGDMEVTGSTNLVTEALDYTLVYIPKVTSSLPVLVAWMVNPPTGLAALLIDRVLHDAQVISRLEYSISGTVSEPIVNEEARTETDVEIPEVEIEQLLEENNDPD